LEIGIGNLLLIISYGTDKCTMR